MKNVIIILATAMCVWSCTNSNKTEKIQKKRDNIIDVHSLIKEIDIDSVLISRSSHLSIAGDYLLISDYKSKDKLIYVFNKNNFRYIAGIGDSGPGPEEITRIGTIVPYEKNRKIYVTDMGKVRVLSFDLDSAINSAEYTPDVVKKLNEKEFLSSYKLLNDTNAVGIVLELIRGKKYNYNEKLVRWNLESGAVLPMKYINPDVAVKRVCFCVSNKYDLCVSGYENNDLIEATDLFGNLKYKIYGPDWNKNNNKSNKHLFYDHIEFCKDKIVASFAAGSPRFYRKQNGKKGYGYSTKFLIFDKDGTYLKTLDTGYNIQTGFVYDEANNRIIMELDDVMQFAYFSLDGILG